MVREDTSVTLSCFDSPPTSSVLVTWKMMSAREDRWSYLLSANCIDGQTDGRSSRVFGGRTFGISADASLIFRAAAAAQGRYSCVIEQDDKKLQERTVLLALIKCRPYNCTITRSLCLNVSDISRYSLLLFCSICHSHAPCHSGQYCETGSSGVSLLRSRLGNVGVSLGWTATHWNLPWHGQSA